MSENANVQNDLDVKVEVPKFGLGQPVEYLSTKGKVKLAYIVGTPESVEEGTSLPVLPEGYLHLAVWTWRAGTFTPRISVPFEGLVAGNAEFEEEGAAVGVWRPLS